MMPKLAGRTSLSRFARRTSSLLMAGYLACLRIDGYGDEFIAMAAYRCVSALIFVADFIEFLR